MRCATFAELRRELDSRIDNERQPQSGGYTLARMRRLMEELDHPQLAVPTVHVAGSKGKGSTCASVASALSASGWRVGLYTSPHLVDPRERIRVGPRPAADALWLAAGERVLAAPAAAEATWYELATAIGFEVFRLAEVDLAVIEVGLGGRLDATNVVQPVACAISRISLEHTAILGDDLATIAGEKAGILKPGVPAVAAAGSEPASAAIRARAAEVGAPLWELGREVTLADGLVTTPLGEHSCAPPGCVPAPSAALALAVVERVSQRLGRSADQASAGLRAVTWPGRRQWLPGPPEVFVDCAHEALSAQGLTASYGARPPGVLLLGVLRDKPIGAILEAVAPIVSHVVACRVPHPRALPAADVAAAARARGLAVTECASPARALHVLRERAAGAGVPGVVCGSVYLAGAVLAALGVDCEPAYAQAT